MKYLRPIILTESMWRPVEDIINRIFETAIFSPLRAALRDSGIEIQNAPSLGLERALKDGTVYYIDGRIYGKFNASISKELRGMGASFDKRTASWKLPAALPARLQLAVAEADDTARKCMEAVIRAMDGIDLKKTIDQSDIQQEYEKGAWRINEDFLKATASLAVVPEFTDAARRIIAREWSENLELYIKDWSSEAILDLRKKVQANTMRGQRAGNLVKMIQETQGVGRTKAKFLARQETSLLMSKMREERFRDIGCESYMWNGMADERERPDHYLLNGKIFSWKNPPITNRKTGARNNPGEDFGPCRCIAIPILPGQ